MGDWRPQRAWNPNRRPTQKSQFKAVHTQVFKLVVDCFNEDRIHIFNRSKTWCSQSRRTEHLSNILAGGNVAFAEGFFDKFGKLTITKRVPAQTW